MKRRTAHLEVDEDANGMSQDFANETMLIMPEVMCPCAGDAKSFCQLRTNRFYAFS